MWLHVTQGAILVYKDANVLKRPQLMAGASQLRRVAEWTLQQANPALDVFIPFENSQLKLKHHCKSHAVRSMVPKDRWEAVFEAPLHHSCQLIARRTPQAEALLWAWLSACLQKEMLEETPDPVSTRHPEFRWHTHEQCMFSLVSALEGNTYSRQLWFCWELRRSAVRELGGNRTALTAPCAAPTTKQMRLWLPPNATRRHGLCLGLECANLARHCGVARTAFAWYPARAPSEWCGEKCLRPS